MKKVGLTIIFILALIFFNPMTVHAAYTPIPGEPLTFKHYFKMRANASVPPVTFLTTITPEADSANEILEGPAPKNGNINDMIANVVYENNSITYTTAQPGDDDIVLNSGEKYAKGQETVHLEMVEFDKPGIYRYRIEGTKDPTRAQDGISQCIPLYLDVHVSNNASGGLMIASRFLHLTTSNEKVNSISDTYTARDIKLINNVTGNLGDKGKDFKYTLNVIGDNAGKLYKVITSTGSIETITSGVPIDINLKHIQELSIYGISENDDFQIVQERAEFYDTSFVIDYDPRVTGLDTTRLAMGKNDRLIIYTNHLNKDTPTTGIISNRIPYIIMIALAVGFGGLFYFKKRRRLSDK